MKKVLWAGLIGGFLVVIGIFLYEKMLNIPVNEEAIIQRDDAKSLDMTIHFGVGTLKMVGGASDWVNGTFDYTDKKWKPSLTYKNKNKIGSAHLKQKSSMNIGFSNKKFQNDWSLQLTNEIPVKLAVSLGVSTANLDLKGIQLSSLAIDSGVGESTIDLSGNWDHSFPVDLRLGVGDTTIYLPKDTGIKLVVSKGVGRFNTNDFIPQGKGVYVNEAYGTAKHTIDLSIDMGVGNVTFKIVD
ncbi:toast rack family protein [Sporosarcina saromensis]|uniref:Toast rack family protein n=1 Tax=Sporosarcina saromensis TaxID=359365 RepID=A0ABU4G7F4_9BACL|nr:toast rack family protein [Sporosarcina saromensis]MDW0112918.1 toast rack family protein [Sporosarcina saromensis]